MPAVRDPQVPFVVQRQLVCDGSWTPFLWRQFLWLRLVMITKWLSYQPSIWWGWMSVSYSLPRPPSTTLPAWLCWTSESVAQPWMVKPRQMWCERAIQADFRPWLTPQIDICGARMFPFKARIWGNLQWWLQCNCSPRTWFDGWT